MQRVVVRLLAGLLAALLLLAERCCADGGGPSLAERVIWAVNAGGDSHVDVHGIQFKKDPLEGKVGKGECRPRSTRSPGKRAPPDGASAPCKRRFNEESARPGSAPSAAAVCRIRRCFDLRCQTERRRLCFPRGNRKAKRECEAALLPNLLDGVHFKM